MERDQDQCKPFSAFDEKIIPESLRFFKCCLSVFPVSMRPVMAILIKFLELKLTIDYFHSILSSLNPDLKEEMDLLQSMMQMMQMSQADGTSGSGNPPDFFKDLFSSSMPDAYDNTENLSKEVNDGRLDETSGIFKPFPDQTGTSASGLSENQGEDRQKSGSGTDGTDRECQ